MRTKPIRIAGIAAVLVLTAAACGSDGDDDLTGGAGGLGADRASEAPAAGGGGAGADEESPSASSSPPRSSGPSGAPTSGASGADGAPGADEPGAALRIGETGALPFEARDGVTGVVEVTPTAIERGDIQDLKDAGMTLTPTQERTVPFYVRVTYKNVSDADLSKTSPDNQMRGIDDKGRTTDVTRVLGGFDTCAWRSPRDFAPGAAYESCRLFLVPANGALTQVSFAFPDENLEPVVWKS